MSLTGRTLLMTGVILIAPLSGFPAEETSLDGLKQLAVIELKGELDHVQGIEVDETRVWVTSVNREDKTGHLHAFDLTTGAWIDQTEVQEGERYHPGGLAGDGSSLWIPVAEYRKLSSAAIQRRDKNTLKLLDRFTVDDHIGCVAVDGGRLIGGNWDSRDLYIWDKSGKQLKKIANPLPTRYQDMKAANGILIASGLLKGRGAIDWVRLDTLELIRRFWGDKTSRGVCFMNEGMALREGKLYLLPEDGPSRLFVFQLD